MGGGEEGWVVGIRMFFLLSFFLELSEMGWVG